MSRKNEPFLGLGYGWDSGENGWGSGYNETVKVLAILSSGGVETIQNDPPTSPTAGKAYIVGTSPTGAWSGKSNYIAYWDNDQNSWLYIQPKVGFMFVVKAYGSSGELYYYGTNFKWNRAIPPAPADANKLYALQNGAWVDITNRLNPAP